MGVEEGRWDRGHGRERAYRWGGRAGRVLRRPGRARRPRPACAGGLRTRCIARRRSRTFAAAEEPTERAGSSRGAGPRGDAGCASTSGCWACPARLPPGPSGEGAKLVLDLARKRTCVALLCVREKRFEVLAHHAVKHRLGRTTRTVASGEARHAGARARTRRVPSRGLSRFKDLHSERTGPATQRPGLARSSTRPRTSACSSSSRPPRRKSATRLGPPPSRSEKSVSNTVIASLASAVEQRTNRATTSSMPAPKWRSK